MFTVRYKETLWPRAQCNCALRCRTFTSTGTETVFLVSVKVVGGGAPAVAITASLGGTAVVFLLQKREGEDTFVAVCVSSKGVQHCQGEKKEG